MPEVIGKPYGVITASKVQLEENRITVVAVRDDSGCLFAVRLGVIPILEGIMECLSCFLLIRLAA